MKVINPSKQILHLSDDTLLGTLQELDDVLNLRTIWHLILDLVDGIEEGCLTMEYQSVGIRNVLANLLGNLGCFHDDGVRTCILHRLSTGNDIRRNILGEGGTCLNHRGLQVVTLCISTAMVLVLLGLVIFSVLMGRNLSSYVKENLVVQVMLEQDVTNPEGLQMCKRLKARPYVKGLTYISKEQALQEATHDLGTNPSEFAGVNPFQPSIEITTQADYANNDSLKWIAKELKSYSRVTEVSYQHDLIEQVNNSLTKISIGLLIVAALLTFISFSLINNTVRLGIYARRFSIHTMKLVGASWGFIRKPFIKRAVLVGVVAALLADGFLGGCLYAWSLHEPELVNVLGWQELAITGGSVFLFGIIITALCANISVNKFLKMKAGDLYKI